MFSAAIPLLICFISIPFPFVCSRSIPFRINEDLAYTSKDTTVLILGGGVAGLVAARTLEEQGISDFIIVEAGNELGGRLKSREFGGSVVELGANWLQGYSPLNPIHTLAIKHGLNTTLSDFFNDITTYDEKGEVNYLKEVDAAIGAYSKLVRSAGQRVKKHQHDASARTGYSIIGSKPRTPYARTSEYYSFDFEYAQKPDQTSWYASSWAHNFTFDTQAGGFSDDNHLCVDQRGFKHIILAEAEEFLDPTRVMLNSTVRKISHWNSGVEVTLTDGSSLNADYAIVTFSLGVLQNDDVEFMPQLPAWKLEGIHSMKMGTFTKIFMQFPEKFWFNTQMGLYADSERGKYPVWQSLDTPGFMPGSGILFTVVTGDFSERIESLSDDQVKNEVIAVLGSMFPDVEIPLMLDFYFERWHTNPLFRGSYSNWPSSFFQEHHDAVRKRVGRLHFAGEHTSAHYFGFLHGAYFEGMKVAEELKQCIKEGCI